MVVYAETSILPRESNGHYLHQTDGRCLPLVEITLGYGLESGVSLFRLKVADQYPEV